MDVKFAILVAVFALIGIGNGIAYIWNLPTVQSLLSSVGLSDYERRIAEEGAERRKR